MENVTSTKKTVSLSWDNICVNLPAKKSLFGNKIKREKVEILKHVHGNVQPGTLLAIMGASGSGKTTLLNVLTARSGSDLKISGRILVNGQQMGSGIKKISAYVQQDDVFCGQLTVREHLWFHAMLRLDEKMSISEKEKKVDDVLQELGLTKCKDSVIGVPERLKSISGGERKRLAFAAEVLTDPGLLFCDEPTSGLDSFMAESVVQNLKTMSRKGRTILCTIHQPSSQTFGLFDKFVHFLNDIFRTFFFFL